MQRDINNDQDDSSSTAIKVVMIISLILISMDVLELTMSFSNLKIASEKFDMDVFENCIKYHIISQMVFTLFALFAGISAFMLSIILLFDSDFFVFKMYKSFLHFNHLIFGPYLLTASTLGFIYFSEICYNCDPNDISKKYFNISTIMSIIVCFMVSSMITVIFSSCHAVRKIMLSIRFRPGGWKFLGRYFWKYVRSRKTNNNNNNNDHNRNAFNPQPVIPNIRIEYIEIREARQDENFDTSYNNINEERRKKAEENIRKRIEEEQKNPESTRIAFNEYTIKKLDDSGTFEEIELPEDSKIIENRKDNLSND